MKHFDRVVKIHDLSNDVDILFDLKDAIKVHGMYGCKRIKWIMLILEKGQ